MTRVSRGVTGKGRYGGRYRETRGVKMRDMQRYRETRVPTGETAGEKRKARDRQRYSEYKYVKERDKRRGKKETGRDTENIRCNGERQAERRVEETQTEHGAEKTMVPGEETGRESAKTKMSRGETGRDAEKTRVSR
ncbi:hypothetical protein NDU88_001882 [Pleurodeles waltl]|uniref:Uncharacterized protein n=1 Tax=Pleurodeles waltl TaxID=8319 RepID=A0AAV7Q7C9_PLEWA|nr:hypothetical protein NDU88_001882 [Pleurodeles waltl]